MATHLIFKTECLTSASAFRPSLLVQFRFVLLDVPTKQTTWSPHTPLKYDPQVAIGWSRWTPNLSSNFMSSNSCRALSAIRLFPHALISAV